MIVDAVVTWVDGSDIAHQNKLRFYQKDTQKLHSVKFRTRFDQVNEIQFTVDSILKHADFVRNIYIITDKQTPDFIRNKTSGSYRNVFII
ncbi:MAG: Stealth CR1 domain-containing protein, partial [Wenyingzhuangia sp.]